jgi:aminopeptidase N
MNSFNFLGGALLYMFMNYLGADDFQKWMQTYLTKHQFNNTVTDDLLSVLAGIRPTEQTIKQNFGTWTYQAGYPLITLTNADGQ